MTKFQLRVAGEDNGNPDKVYGVYVSSNTVNTSGSLSGKGVAVVVNASNTVELQIHDGTNLYTKDLTLAGIGVTSGSVGCRFDLVITWDGSSTLSLYAALATNASGSLGRPVLLGSLTQAMPSGFPGASAYI